MDNLKPNSWSKQHSPESPDIGIGKPGCMGGESLESLITTLKENNFSSGSSGSLSSGRSRSFSAGSLSDLTKGVNYDQLLSKLDQSSGKNNPSSGSGNLPDSALEGLDLANMSIKDMLNRKPRVSDQGV